MSMNYILEDNNGYPLGECYDCDYSKYDSVQNKWVCVYDDECYQEMGRK